MERHRRGGTDRGIRLKKKKLKITQHYVLPFAIPVHQPSLLQVPGAREVYVQCAVRWNVGRGELDSTAWRQLEYEMVERKVGSIKMGIAGKPLAEVAIAIAVGINQVLPGRNMSVMAGAFGIEYKYEDVMDEGHADHSS